MEATSAKPSANHIPALDGLRAVAVLSVIGYHLDVLHLRGGYLGVDLFFVLSGFLITRLLVAEHDRTRSIALRRFWVRRVRRLTPAILLLMAAVAVWGAVVLDPFSLHNLRNDMFATLGYVANWRFIAAGQSYFAEYSNPSPLRHMWSLAIEEQFYMVWPMLVLVALRIARGRRILLGTVVAVLIAGSTVLLWILHDPADPSRAYYGTDTRLAQLLVGAGLAIVMSPSANRRTRDARPGTVALARFTGPLALAGVVASCFLVGDTTMFMYRGGFLAFSVVVALLLWSVVTAKDSMLDIALSWGPAVWIGQISYGLYLWHWPVQVALSPDRTGLDGPVLALVRLATTFAVTLASYHLLEQPVRHTRGWAGAITGGRAVLAAGTSVLALFSTIVVATRDSERLPDYLDATTGEILTSGVTVAQDATGPVESVPTLVLTGDSLAHALRVQLGEFAALDGVHFFSRALPGCSLTRGVPTDDDGTPFSGSLDCENAHRQFLEETVNQHLPDDIVWFDSWDARDRIVDGVFYVAGTAEWTAKMTDLVDESVSILASRGARIHFVSVAPVAIGNSIDHTDPGFDARVGHLNEVLRRYAKDHPETTSFIDLASRVCPSGPPCPAIVDGIELRPKDGVHFDGEGARWAARIILDAIASERGWPAT